MGLIDVSLFSQSVWSGILNADTVEDTVDFFNAGAGSMDVTR